MKSNRDIVVYTAVTNNYNPVRNPQVVDDSIDYVCFTDQLLWHRMTTDTIWKFAPIPQRRLDPARRNRFVKLHPHLFFSQYEYSVYVDGCIDITGDIRALIAKYDHPRMLVFKHPLRQCIYAEGDECMRRKKDDPAAIFAQLEHYRSEGYPSNAGLIEAGVLIRRHDDGQVNEVMEDWWQEVLNRSRRDQISFPYVARKHRFWPSEMGESSAWGASDVFRVRDDKQHGAARQLTLRGRVRALADTYLLWRFRGR